MKQKFLSYAQEWEDFFLHLLFEEVENGFYVDVGANSPWYFSVTKHFYEKGWSGVNIEPLPEMFAELCQDRLRDININCGCGSEEKELEFTIAGMLTTCDPETATELKQKYNNIKKEKILIRKLTDIISELNLLDKTIHFLKIDVEGFEGDVLKGIDFSLFRPSIVVMEATVPGTSIACHDSWEYVLTQNSYIFLFSYGINRYYVDAKNLALLSSVKTRIETFQEGFNQYELYKVVYGVTT